MYTSAVARQVVVQHHYEQYVHRVNFFTSGVLLCSFIMQVRNEAPLRAHRLVLLMLAVGSGTVQGSLVQRDASADGHWYATQSRTRFSSSMLAS
jgi:hypothetical protein